MAGTPTRPKDLDPGTPTAGADLIFDSGTQVLRTDPLGLVNAATPLASQSEAEAGTDNTKRVTPLRVAQGVSAQALVPLASPASDKGSSLVTFLPAGASAAARSVQDVLRQIQLSVLDYRQIGELDIGVWVNRAVAAAQSGTTISFPAALADIVGLTWATAASDGGKCLHFQGGAKGSPTINIAGAIAALTISGYGSSVSGFNLDGTRTAGQIGVKVLSSISSVSDMLIQKCDKGVYQAQGAGFHQLYSNLRFRNNVTCHMHMEDGVGPFIFDCKGDTDGTWYGGSYPFPTAAGLWIQTEGVQFDGCDFIHGGLSVEVPSFRNIDWLLGSNSYFDSAYDSPGVRIINTQGGRHIRGLFFNQVWAATNRKGYSIEGTQAIDGVFLIGCPIHNNILDGIVVTNTNSTSIFVEGCAVVGNNAAVPTGGSAKVGTGNQVSIYTSGVVNFSGGNIGPAMQWSTTSPYLVYVDAVATSTQFTGTFISTGGFTTAQISNAGGALFNMCPGVSAGGMRSSTTIERVRVGGSIGANLWIEDNVFGRAALRGTAPAFDWYESGAAADKKFSRWFSSSGALSLQAMTDAYAVQNAGITFERGASGFTRGTMGVPLKKKIYTVAALPTGQAGDEAFVSDSNATTYAAIVAGGGANNIPVYHDGTNWRIG